MNCGYTYETPVLKIFYEDGDIKPCLKPCPLDGTQLCYRWDFCWAAKRKEEEKK